MRTPIAPWTPPPEIGEFRLERLVGHGAMADVWLARDTLLARHVALKIARTQATAEARTRFRVEARAIAKLQHPNLLAVHQVGEVSDRPFLVSELLAGSSLDQIERPVVPQTLLAIGRDLARGLAAVHRIGVVHCDIKPANAFLCEDGSAKLLDFGLATLSEGDIADFAETWKDIDSSTDAFAATRASPSNIQAIAGTPLYMAPETWRGAAPTRRSDVYSLGALLFELLVGHPPYGGASIVELRANVLAGRFEDIGKLAPDASPAFIALVERCLSLAPDDRLDADELRDAFDALAFPVPAQDELADDPTTNPYRGLLVFGSEHRALFFGRNAETSTVVEEMRGSPIVLVVAPSGSGKSSLVRAGVLPRVRDGHLGIGDWRTAIMVPGSYAIERLAEALAPVTALDEYPLKQRLKVDAEGLAHELAARRGPERFVLLLDQAEELWTLCSSGERATFLQALAALCSAWPTFRAVLTLRADFLPRAEDLGALEAQALRSVVTLGPMSADGLRDAITGPARRRGASIEPALVEQLVASSGAGSLPLVEFALEALWEGRDRRTNTVTLAQLDALGGLEGALARHADASIARLPRGMQNEAKRLLLALVTVEGTRARRAERALLAPRGREAARHAMDALIHARLVIASNGEEGTEYEIAHETLISGWPALRDWLDEAAHVRAAADRVERAAAEWQRLGRPDDALLTGPSLERLEGLEGLELAARESAFVDASRNAARGARRRRILARAAVPILLLGVTAATWGTSFAQRTRAIRHALDDAHALATKLDDTSRTAEERRSEAFALFEMDALGPAESAWRETLAREDEANAEREDVCAALDRVLALDPGNREARDLYADVTYERILSAERLHEDALLPSLQARLALYDDDSVPGGGTRFARLSAPGHVRAESDPPDAAVTVAHYRPDAMGHLLESSAAPFPLGAAHDLDPGSYVLHTALHGRYSTTYPFVVHRGESLSLHVVLPLASAIPEGMVYVPAGSFDYGSDDTEAARSLFDHQPVHPVDLGAFLIGRLEVTNGEYLAFLRAIPDTEKKEHLPNGLTFDAKGRATITMRDITVHEGERYCLPGRPCVELAQLPVDYVSRDDAEAFTRWLSSSARIPGARLCTDREWERAARGADRRRFPGGNADPEPEDACTLLTYGGDDRRAGPCAAGAHPISRSVFGVFDMEGNVWEWVADAADVAHAQVGIERGGSWSDLPIYLVITNRAMDSRVDRSTSGFRVCADAPSGG